MNDDELGRALATVLAAPDVQAAPDAGAKLRARARRQRAQQWAVGGAVTAVLALVLAVGVVRLPASDPAPVAAGPTYGHSLLRVPVAVRWCPTHVGGCGPVPVLALDEVLRLQVIELPGSGAVVELTLTRDDDRTLDRTPLPQQAQFTAVADTLSYPAMREGNTVRIRVRTPRLGAELVALLAPYAPVARTGPGRLNQALQVWSVVTSDQPSCRVTRSVLHVFVVNRLGECLFLGGPVVMIDAADVRIHPPAAVGGEWGVTVDPSGPSRQALVTWTGRHAGERVALGVAGQLVGPTAVVQRGQAWLDIAVVDRGAAAAVVSRMRP